MDLKIRNVILNYEQGLIENVTVSFESFEGDLNLHGSIKITKAEYDANSGMSDLQVLVEGKLKAKFSQL